MDEETSLAIMEEMHNEFNEEMLLQISQFSHEIKGSWNWELDGVASDYERKVKDFLSFMKAEFEAHARFMKKLKNAFVNNK